MKCGRWFWMKSSWRGDIIVFSEKKKKKRTWAADERDEEAASASSRRYKVETFAATALLSPWSPLSSLGAVQASPSVFRAAESDGGFSRMCSCCLLSYPPRPPPSTLLVHFPSHLCRVQYIKKIGRKTNVYYFTQTRPHFVKSRKCVVLKYLLDSLWLLFYSSTWEGTLLRLKQLKLSLQDFS